MTLAHHDHGGHGHGPVTHTRTLAVVLSITVTVLVVQVAGALLSGSLALLADSGHMLTDALGLTMALVASVLMRRPATDRMTWGLRRVEVIAAAVQALVLLGVGVSILVEAVRRLVEPGEIAPLPMLVFGAVGLAGNVVGIVLLTRQRHDNLNMRAAFLEVLVDTLGSVAVLAAAAVVALTGFVRADAVASLLIAALILPRTVALLREASAILLESTPRGVDLADVRRHLLSQPHVLAVHDLHASTVGTSLPIISAHVVVADECFHDGHLMTLLDDLQACLAEHFDIAHSTVQFESTAHADHEPAVHR